MSGAVQRGLAPSRAVLPNGMTIVTKQARTTPAVTLHAAVRAGAVYDPPGQPGLAHFVARTIDRGTERHSADDIAEALDSRGVSLTISTTRHTVNVVASCLVEDFEPVLGLVGEILMTPVFPPAEVETRRREIVTLIRQDEDSPAFMAVDALMQALYGWGHPYGRPIRGTADSVGAVDSAALQQFHDRFFRPAAVSLVLVGDIEAGKAAETAGRIFAPWPAAPSVDLVVPDLPAIPARQVRVVSMPNKAQADIAYGFRSIARADPDYYAYSMMNNILGQYSLGGRLGDSIREKQGMAYYVFSSLDAHVIPGPLIIRAGVHPDNVARTVATIDAELTRFAAEGPTETEVAESRQYLIGSLPRTLETNVGIAQFLQSAELFGLGLDYDVRLPGLLEAVTRDDIHAAARRTLDPSKATVAVAGPYEGGLA